MDRWTDRWTDRQTGRGRQADRQIKEYMSPEDYQKLASSFSVPPTPHTMASLNEFLVPWSCILDLT